MVRFVWVLALLAVVAPASAAPLVLVERGQARATLVVGTDPSEQAQGAAQELQSYLQRITGAQLPIAARPGSGANVLIGQAAARDAAARLGLPLPTGQTYLFNDEGYVIASDGETLILAGNETEPYEGTYFAVYDFLHSLGCRWYFPGEFGEVVPRRATVTVPALRRTVRPDMRVRDTWYSGHLATTAQQQEEFRIWKRRNRMSRTALWLHCADPNARFLQNPVDDSTYRLLPKEKYWETHPEFYSLNPGGTRNERFLCMANPGALQAAADTVAEYFRDNPNHHTFAFSPPDAPVLCHCPACTEAMHGGYGGEGEGEVSDAYFGFVFRLADEVARRCPNRWVASMAYYNRCRPPEGVEGKRKNLLIQLASIQQCALHSYTDPRCASRQEFGAMFRRWAELSAGQVFYEYAPHDWTHLQRPTWRSQGIAEDYRLMKKLGGWGYSNEGQMAWLSTGLNYYVRARIAWNVDEDPAAMIRDFCRRFFGPVATPMHRYYTTVEQALRDAPVHFSSPAADEFFTALPRPLLDRCAAWLEQAGRLATAEPYRSRVAAFQIHFDRFNALEKARAAMARGDYAAAARFGEAMLETVARVGNSALLQDAGPWGGSLTGAAVTAFAKRVQPWTDGTKGRLIAALPAEALFRADPASRGVVGRWYLPDANTKGWRSIRLTADWITQGVSGPDGALYRGLGWYRVPLELPQGVSGRVRLFFPEVKGSDVWVWCNGVFAGHTRNTGSALMTVDLEGRLRPGRNLIALRVQGSGGRSPALCVRGEGGISLPPFLFVPLDEGEFPDKRTELSVLPAQWLFRTDPEGKGEALGWARPDLSADGWRQIPVPAVWEETWVGAYDADAWYRVRFTIPAEARGKRLVLRFGAVDEQAWVYLNGELIGEHTEQSTGETVHQIWDRPFEVPLTNARFGEENVLAVRVRDSVGAGGIWKPVRLYQLP